ncbi:cell division protein FtsQ/DivIB [Effusibacillus pohliae]|uniref:cell division protein FtsQ/DivIB n=1 Tax=Effusibacillus pohliae TaxID=232270 RepID=UPI00035CA536|nr:FtsQ-type POTRA domain-containing protein [Effusibacillus pohliae]
MILEQRRTVPEQKRKRSRKARVLLVVFFAGVAVAVFFTSPLSKVRTVEVVGNSQIPAEQIRNASGVREGMNFWEVKPVNVDKRLKSQFPLIAKADVEVKFPGNVVIAVAEKPVAAALYSQGSYYRLLSDGTVFDAVKEIPNGTLPLLISDKPLQIEPGKQIPDPDVQKFCEQIVKVDRSLLEQISNFVIRQGSLWSAWTNSPHQFEIRFPPGDISTTLTVYMKFWKKELQNKVSGTIYIYGPDEAWYDPSSAKPEKE